MTGCNVGTSERIHFVKRKMINERNMITNEHDAISITRIIRTTTTLTPM